MIFIYPLVFVYLFLEQFSNPRLLTPSRELNEASASLRVQGSVHPAVTHSLRIPLPHFDVLHTSPLHVRVFLLFLSARVVVTDWDRNFYWRT